MISHRENSHLSTARSTSVPEGERDSLLKVARQLAQRETAGRGPSGAQMRNGTWAASAHRSLVQEINIATSLGTLIHGVATAASSFHTQIPLHRHNGRCPDPMANPKPACYSAHPQPVHRGFPNMRQLRRPTPSCKHNHHSRARGLLGQLLKGKVARAKLHEDAV